MKIDAIPFLVVLLAFSGCDDVKISTHHSSSMAPTIKPGSMVKWRKLNEPKKLYRKQLVVSVSPLGADRGEWVNRIVGLEGELLMLTDLGCEIDGVLMTWAQLKIPAPMEKLDIKDKGATRIPKDSFYLLGDNISNSRDSREFGPFSEADIIGEVIEINGEEIEESRGVR